VKQDVDGRDKPGHDTAVSLYLTLDRRLREDDPLPLLISLRF